MPIATDCDGRKHQRPAASSNHLICAALLPWGGQNQELEDSATGELFDQALLNGNAYSVRSTLGAELGHNVADMGLHRSWGYG